MATEIIRDRKIYRILTDATNKVWDRINFLTNAKSVDADDGKSLETKVGAINGITSDLSGESDTIAASISAVNKISKIEDITDIVSGIAGGEFSVDSCYKYGKVVFLHVLFTPISDLEVGRTSTSAQSVIIGGTGNSEYYPLQTATTVGWHMSRTLICRLGTDGSLSVRNMGDTPLPAGTTTSYTLTYLIA